LVQDGDDFIPFGRRAILSEVALALKFRFAPRCAVWGRRRERSAKLFLKRNAADAHDPGFLMARKSERNWEVEVAACWLTVSCIVTVRVMLPLLAITVIE
jgi:hypothetical protein